MVECSDVLFSVKWPVVYDFHLKGGSSSSIFVVLPDKLHKCIVGAQFYDGVIMS